ncbi:MAG: TonB-dependent receptor [Agarilytica sp.]
MSASKAFNTPRVNTRGIKNMYTRLGVKISLASILFTSPFAHAIDINGTVTDTGGNAVEGARVHIEGSNLQVFTDSNGQYNIKNFDADHVHIHVYSPHHIHGDREIESVSESVQADFQLRFTRVENVIVTANPLRSSVLESTIPVSVLEGDALENQQAPTLGESLANMPGVHSAYFGPGSSSPVIRGTDGPRVKILQNGMDVGDASRVGGDHNVATESSSASQIEVIRGPATLQFGSGAIGGVVNVVDQRIPSAMPESGFEGEAKTSLGTVAEEEYGRVNFIASAGSTAFYLDAFSRKSDDIDIPGFAEAHHDEEEESEEEHEEHEDEQGTLENSGIDNQGITIGSSLIGDWGYAGISVEHMENRYGVPGHAHEEAHNDEPGPSPTPVPSPEPEAHEKEEEVVEIDAELTRFQAAAEWHSPFEGISAIRYRGTLSDYEHTEFENGETGTVFSNETMEHKVALQHENIEAWHGVLGLHYSQTDYAADGEEAFTPSNDSSNLAFFVVEERNFGDINLQAGARVETSNYQVNDHVEVELAPHEEEEEEEAHHEIEVPDQDFTSLSFSFGSVWRFTQGQSVAASLSRSERAPSHQEMFSAGQHIATRTFDIGLAYVIEEGEEEGEYEVERGGDIEKEVSNNLDITWRLFEGDTTASVTMFYNQVSNYVYQADTGIVAEVEAHAHEGGEEGEEEHIELPVYKFFQDDATLHGLEAELQHHFAKHYVLGVYGDLISAEIDGGHLPRIPPMRIGSSFGYESSSWSANLRVNWYDDQTDVAEFEEESEGYMLVDANISYRFNFADSEWKVFLKGRNLTDEEARPHVSFLKELAPLPGRGFTLGVSTHF